MYLYDIHDDMWWAVCYVLILRYVKVVNTFKIPYTLSKQPVSEQGVGCTQLKLQLSYKTRVSAWQAWRAFTVPAAGICPFCPPFKILTVQTYTHTHVLQLHMSMMSM